MEECFTKLYESNTWGNNKMIDYTGSSGYGSSIIYNKDTFIPFLKKFITDNNIKNIVDLGCGDFICGKLIYDDLDIVYTGYDAYKKVIDFNSKTYSLPKYSFIHLDFCNNKKDIINGDLCILKDVIQHWSLDNIYTFLDYIVENKKFKYILICNCCNQSKDDTNIPNGDWRPLSCEYFPLKKYNPIKLYNYHTKEVSVINTIKDSNLKHVSVTEEVIQKNSQQKSTLVEEQLNFDYDRNFTLWLKQNNCTIIVSSYSKQKVYSIGIKPSDGTLSIYYTNCGRPMGLCNNGSTLYIATSNSLLTYENKGLETDPTFGVFDAAFYPQHAYLSGDVDCHDLRVNSKGDLFYISTLFNCICKPSMTKSFEVYYVPPWITKTDKGLPPGEDRCHLNGLCLVDGKPRYVTASCNKDYHMAWRDHMLKGGLVYDIIEDRVVVDGLTCPHSPQMYKGKLWVLNAGTGEFGWVDIENKKFVPKKLLPGFLRGLSFVNNYAVICLSSDRHDTAFSDLPLGKILQEQGQKAKVGIFIIDMDTFDIKHKMQFYGDNVEFYDALVIPGITRPRVYDVGDSSIVEKFHL